MSQISTHCFSLCRNLSRSKVLPQEPRISPAIQYPAVAMIVSFSQSQWQQSWNSLHNTSRIIQKSLRTQEERMWQWFSKDLSCVFVCYGGFFPQIQMPVPPPNFNMFWIRGTLKNVENRWFLILPTMRNITLSAFSKELTFFLVNRILFSKSSFFILNSKLSSHFYIPPTSNSQANSNIIKQKQYKRCHL